MANLDQITESILEQIDTEGFRQEGAYNLRYNGYSLCHGNTEHITIKRKEDKQGIDVYISGQAKGEQVHIPVVVAASGMVDEVYNDFYIGKNANVRYEEKHYGEGEGTGARILNPVTKIYMDDHCVFTLDTAQIKGVDSTKRETEVVMGEGSKLFVIEKLMTHDGQSADMDIYLNGTGSSAQIISRSVARGKSRQVFHPRAIGNALCHAHIQCDSIIMDQAQVCSIPEIDAKHVDAAIIHEAAIGRINSEQLIKLNTFGLSDEAAEAIIIENFLN